MISYGWHDDVPAELADELRELLAGAAEYDAEAGFSTARPDAIPLPGARVHHLLVSMLPRGERGSPDLDRLPDARVVAYLRLDVVDGVGEAQFVVRPEFRSLGVGTLLMERLAEEPDGWAAVEGLTAVGGWSHGAHPAAERMSWRFDAKPTQLLFKQIVLLPPDPSGDGVADVHGGEPFEPAVEVAPGHGLGLAPADAAMWARLDTRLHADGVEGAVGVGPALEDDRESAAPVALLEGGGRETAGPLLRRALSEARARGARVAALYVDIDDEDVLRTSRELGFFHDQSDCRYLLQLNPA